MARGISIRDVSNKIKNINDNDVLPISTGDNQPEVVEIGTVKNYIKEDIDDADGYDGIVFNRWYADTVSTGIPIEWDEMI